MIESGFNYLYYNDDGSLDNERTAEAFLEYMEELSREDIPPNPMPNDSEITHIYVVMTTPSSAHWYEKTIADLQGSHYSHVGITFDKKMSTLYHVRGNGLMVSKRDEYKKEKIAMDLYRYPVKANEKDKLKNLIQRMLTIETKYDFLMIGKLLGKIIFRKEDKKSDANVTPEQIVSREKYICSGWVAGVMAATIKSFRNYLIKKRKKWTTFMPVDFMNIQDLVLDRRILFPDNKVLMEFKE
jgi:hypothetical protein